MRALAVVLAAGALCGFVPAALHASPPKVGGKCPSAGQAIQSLHLVCVKKGGKLVWAPFKSGGSNGNGGQNNGGGNSGGNSGGSNNGGSSGGNNPGVSELTLTAVPVDLSQIQEISKFRSCTGHDYSGMDTDGQLETNRSMKHYFGPISSLIGSTGMIKVYAPASGTVTRMQAEESGRGTQIWIGASQISWNVILFHLDPVSGLALGSTVTAGQLVGYANLANAFNFDIAYGRPGGSSSFIYDSIFNHMSSSVSSAFAARGITASNIILPKSTRDASPCADFRDHGDDFVQLTG